MSYRKSYSPIHLKGSSTPSAVVVVGMMMMVLVMWCMPVTSDAHLHLAKEGSDDSSAGCPFSKKKKASSEGHTELDHHHDHHHDHNVHHDEVVGVADSTLSSVSVVGGSKSPVASWIHTVVLEGIWGMLGGSRSSSSKGTTPPSTTTPNVPPPPPRTRQSLVLEALCASGMTSLLPALLVLALPTSSPSSSGVGSSPGWKTVLFRWMLSGGAGGLVGDVVFHTLPSLVQQSGLGSHGHQHADDHHHHDGHDHHSHDHTASSSAPTLSSSPTSLGGAMDPMWVEVASLTPLHAFIAGIAVFYVIDCILQSLHHHHDGGGSGDNEKSSKGANRCHDSHTTSSSASSSSSSVVLLGMVGDVLHNFCDGLVIGAAFMSGAGAATATATGPVVSAAGRHGWKTSVLIMVHEIPHECGDFALLLQAGWGRFSALGMQMVTALGSFSGVLLVYFTDPSPQVMQGVLVPLASGSFVYLAISSMLGELKRSRVELLLPPPPPSPPQTTTTTSVTSDKNITTTSSVSSHRMKSALLVTFSTVGEVVTFLLGAQVMWWILQVEDLWGTHAHHH